MDGDSYLWNKTGTTDRELLDWEENLAGFSSKTVHRPTLVLPPRRAPKPATALWIGIAAAACLLLALSAILLRIAWQPRAAWTVTTLAGSPTINDLPLTADGRLSPGELLKTDRNSRAKLRMGFMGTIEVEPDSNIVLSTTRFGRHRFALKSGKIAAHVFAPPFTLFVETPSATAIDLGCSFTLQASPNGSGELHVRSGWVELTLNDRQAIVPEGAMVFTRSPNGPGTPFFEDSSPAFRAALEQLDFGSSAYHDSAALAIVLAEARARDTISLLSLLTELPPDFRPAVFDRAAALVPPPPGLKREDVVRGTNFHGMDDWWKLLHLGEAKSWILNWRDVFDSAH
jgi:hypothetical protein